MARQPLIDSEGLEDRDLVEVHHVVSLCTDLEQPFACLDQRYLIKPFGKLRLTLIQLCYTYDLGDMYPTVAVHYSAVLFNVKNLRLRL